jgi:hypothetical protein
MTDWNQLYTCPGCKAVLESKYRALAEVVCQQCGEYKCKSYGGPAGAPRAPVWEAIPRTAEEIQSRKDKQRKRRRQTQKKERPLTAAQAQAMHIVGEHKGNIAAAAKAVGISRQAMDKRYKGAIKKLGRSATPKPKTQALPTDHRGQVNI